MLRVNWSLCVIVALMAWLVVAEPTPAIARRQQPASFTSYNIPASAAAGSMSVLQPAITASPTLLKIPPSPGQDVFTFSWSYSDVIATPATLTLQAYCAENGRSYPIGPATGIAGGQSSFAWDIGAYQATAGASPLIQATYTFRAFDQRGFYATPAGGYLSPQNGPVFYLYSPQPYVPLDQWKCAQCSSASILRSSSPILLVAIASIGALLAGGLSVFRRR